MDLDFVVVYKNTKKNLANNQLSWFYQIMLGQ